MPYCQYLRKSRVDLEAEAHGEGETLARHEKLLAETARRMNIEVTGVYKEVVSGESIASRPEMLRLLEDVERGLWEGVLVVEVERLARGDSIDQGIVARSFKFSNTKIITPHKTYDPNNEFDEEYFEFGLFMSRREYKTINRRLQSGRVASVKEGKFVGNRPPYGYHRVKLEHEKGFTLEPIPEQAEVVRLIFSWYVKGKLDSSGKYRGMGLTAICRELSAMKIPTRSGSAWSSPIIKGILTNPVYVGKVRWNYRPQKKSVLNGVVSKSRPRANPEDWILVDGLHPAILDPDLFDKAQQRLKDHPQRPGPRGMAIKNPLAGIVVCGMCGHNMVRRPYSGKYPDTFMCATLDCKNVSSNLSLVEAKLMEAIEKWLDDYKLKWNRLQSDDTPVPVDYKEKALIQLETELKALAKRRNQIHDFLEQGIYTTEVFMERSRILADKIAQTNKGRIDLLAQIEEEKRLGELREQVIPKFQKVLERYFSCSIEEKNEILKEILIKVEYIKTVNGRWHNRPDDFQLKIYPKVPKTDAGS